MKKALIPIMSALLIATLFAGCRKNVATETTGTTAHTTQTTAPATTHATTRPTQATRPAPSSQPTRPNGTPMPTVTPETSDATDATGRGRAMPPRY